MLDEERIIEVFQKPIANMTRIMGEHSPTAGAMEVEKSQLKKEINDWKLQAEELKSAKEEKEARIWEMEARLSELELEKVQLVSTWIKRLQALNDAKLEKDEILQKLQAGQRELAGLAALEAAATMQKQITAKREQIAAFAIASSNIFILLLL
ncbi:unnamed protein product [Coccothraustes coccothraustes]